jgi:hypothetical protein
MTPGGFHHIMLVVGANLGPTESKANRPMGNGQNLSSASIPHSEDFVYLTHPRSDEAMFALFLPRGGLALRLRRILFLQGPGGLSGRP